MARRRIWWDTKSKQNRLILKIHVRCLVFPSRSNCLRIKCPRARELCLMFGIQRTFWTLPRSLDFIKFWRYCVQIAPGTKSAAMLVFLFSPGHVMMNVWTRLFLLPLVIRAESSNVTFMIRRNAGRYALKQVVTNIKIHYLLWALIVAPRIIQQREFVTQDNANNAFHI